MAIKSFEDQARVPIIGKIRLGEKKVSQNGKEYPVETPHFVLTDAPGVEAVYGKNPTSLDVVFLDPEPQNVMPYFYKWYSGGVKDKDGKMIGGQLQCYGDGQEATYLLKRDPATRHAPKRPCLAEQCPDWKNSRGIQQCRPSMSVYAMLPLVTPTGVFQIDTNSIASIRNFVSVLGHIRKVAGRVNDMPFRIYRAPTSITFTDSDGKKQSRVHYVMQIEYNEQFAKEHGAQVRQVLDAIRGRMLAPAKELIEASTNEVLELESGAAEVQEPADTSKLLSEDPDLLPLFDELAVLMKKPEANTSKTRHLTVRKFESAKDQKSAVADYLKTRIAELQDKAKVQVPPKPQKTVPQPNSDGLI
ncbi:MAG: hypothetical protein EBZ49_00600 [Proteobacteria bacterium]|nr:hypothetical protein [Pseudomonadota bacterium]